jgi:hypothetical protein
MYWNNPIQEFFYLGSDSDPIAISQHHGEHCLFWNPAVERNTIKYQQTLQDLCDWANRGISHQGLDAFLSEPLNHYDCANFVKLNMWLDDIKQQGVIKPMLLYPLDNGFYAINNGESRLRVMERLPNITSVSAFITTTTERRAQFQHLQPVDNFDQFAQICGAVPDQAFLFKFTQAQAPYGIEWYEYNSARTQPVTVDQNYCLEVLGNYLRQHTTTFSPEWFDILVSWDNYKN